MQKYTYHVNFRMSYKLITFFFQFDKNLSKISRAIKHQKFINQKTI